MNAIEQIEPLNTEPAERPVLHRTYQAELTAGDGRTVDVRIVPYGEQITHNDGLGGVPKGVPYQEEWVYGAFSEQAKAATVGRAKKVLVNFEHGPGLRDVVGHGLVLREAADGYYGSFRLHDTPDGDKALLLINEDILDGVSMEVPYQTVKSVRAKNGVIQRVKGHLQGIALTRHGAYQGATVLAVREEAEIVDEELLPVAPDPELIARCQRLGIKLPQRYQAHPAETDTPAESGTSEDGTRHTPETSSEE